MSKKKIFQKIFIEKQIAEHSQTRKILRVLPDIPQVMIEKIEDIFGRAKKPYLQKRNNLNLFIGRKKGALLKEAPLAYGLDGDPHYYFIHAYNCIYECEYCYLQGYFHSPDLVLFVNHDEIVQEMEKIIHSYLSTQTVWFHAGEFSDSLALTHVSQEWAYYWQFFQKFPNAKLELRTKSVNIRPLLALEPLNNVIVSFSLAPWEPVKKYDRKTPSLQARLKAIAALASAGYRIGLHFDPIIYQDDFKLQYQKMLNEIINAAPEASIEYVSLGVVRFSREVYAEFIKNYPRSDLLAAEFIKSFDGKIRYNRPQRLFILKTVRDLCYNVGIQPEKVYLCMENNSTVEEA